MDKFCKFAPLVCAILWSFCLIMAIAKDSINYRWYFIAAAGVLIITNLAWFWRENDVRKVEKLNTEQRRDTESDNKSEL